MPTHREIDDVVHEFGLMEHEGGIQTAFRNVCEALAEARKERNELKQALEHIYNNAGYPPDYKI